MSIKKKKSKTIEHIITQEDIDITPNKGLVVGETIQIPINDTIEEKLKKEEITKPNIIKYFLEKLNIIKNPVLKKVKKVKKDEVLINNKLKIKKKVIANRRG